MNVPKERPQGGKRVVVDPLVLKEYSNGDNLAGRCGVTQKMYKGWVEKFSDHTKHIDLANLFFLIFLLSTSIANRI